MSRAFPEMSVTAAAKRAEVEIIAHRGYSAAAPENTLAALEAAIVAGADAIEFDLHVTRDGVPVLFHDTTLDRTTDGSGPLDARSLAELRGLDAGSWFDRRFAGEPIPTFSDAVARTLTRVGRIYPEVKVFRDRSALARLVDEVAAHDALDRAVFISMDWEALDEIRARRADARIGYIVEDVRRAPEGFERAAGDPRALLDFKAAILLDEPALAHRACEEGIDLAVWTVDDAARATRLQEIGVRRITTNRVSDLLAWKGAL